MRVRMQLSAEAKRILNEEERLMNEEEEANFTYGWLLNRDLSEAEEYGIENIDWKEIKGMVLSLPKGTCDSDEDYNTTLNMTRSSVEIMENLQRMFLDVFGTRRVHKAFVAKMVLRWHYMKIVKGNN